jgi:hypothetical protein
MNHLTLEELCAQIMAACLLINSQGKWHAFYDFSGHVGQIEVRLVPSDHDYQSGKADKWQRMDATFTSTNRHQNPWLTEETARQALVNLLAWTHSYTSVEAAA